MTGDGSLGLVRGDNDVPADLSPPPQVRDYDQVEREIEAELDKVGPIDLLKQTFGGGSP